jgi:hypothetical protein
MRTHDEWKALLSTSIPWRQRYAVVEEVVREHLADIAPGHTLTTRQLAEKLYPVQYGEEGAKLLKKLYQVLGILACHGMADCVQKGKPHPIYGQRVTPVLWRHKLKLSTPVELPADNFRQRFQQARDVVTTYLNLHRFDMPQDTSDALAKFLAVTLALSEADHS